ncbi:MAG: SRPBCC family protein [Anaerolineae bacterium]|nr:SRPBCC family protein [Anaerolineae bacterium]
MASITKEVWVNVRPEDVWAVVRDVGAAHVRLFPGILTDCYLDGDARVVTFANGMVARELIVDVDDLQRRFVYASVGGRTTHHNASLQVFADGENSSRVVWITDLLPNEIAPSIRDLVERGSSIMKQTLESAMKSQG